VCVGVWVSVCVCVISDEELCAKCGVDAVHYQKFQRYLLVYLGASTVLCLAVILPINLTQGSYGKLHRLAVDMDIHGYIHGYIHV